MENNLEKKNPNEIDNIINNFKKCNPNLNDYKLLDEVESIYAYLDIIKNKKDVKPYLTSNSEIDYSFIARMMNIIEKCFKFIPRKTQIISLLYFLKKDEKSGLIQQIDTGEGKSIIISLLAVYLAKKKNKKIDILTSSPILAQRDSSLFKQFYENFGLTVDYSTDHNEETKVNNKEYSSQGYKCYKADIVYGDALSFEGDILRTNFMGIMGRGKERMYDCIIIDEIDNIALDNLKNTTELLDCFHGYKFLEYVYLFIYWKLKQITENKNESISKDEIIRNLYEESSKEFEDLQKLRKEKKVFIPEHLNQYIQQRLNDWCESAYIAKFIYHNNENYVINDNNEYKIKEINPIDFYNTGVTQENSIWSGLHQFLQIHEKQMITEDNLSSCYMSNLSYFQKYINKDKNNNIIENNIYGLTGTIGSEYNIKTLKELYNLGTLIIPPFKDSLLKIEEPKIIILKQKQKEKKKGKSNEKSNNLKSDYSRQITIEHKWFENIEEKIIEIINQKRAVLVIFQYISEATQMGEILRKKRQDFKNIILYLRSDKNEGKFLDKNIEPKTIILSTNLSCRGTDIKISSKLNKNGGLHVILTYEPFNKRIERQAFGRAGRKGENGSAGKIIISCFTKEDAINEINNREEKESNFLINVYRKKIEVFEKIFDRFSDFIREIDERTHDDFLLLDLKERWGLFLIENNLNNIEKKYKKNPESIDSNTFNIIEQNYFNFEKNLKNYYYGFDWTITNFNSIWSKAKNIVYSKSNKEYEFMNGLYLNKTKDIQKINKGIKISPHLCLGGYMFIIMKNIEQITNNKGNDNNNNYDNKLKNESLKDELNNKLISDTYQNFDTLINNIQLLKEQFDYYKQIIGKLGYNKENLEISQQNNQKIKLMELILELMKENKEVFKDYVNQKYLIQIKRISLKKFVKFKKLTINELIIEYFREYGINLFILKKEQKKKDNSNDCYIS